MSKVKLSEIANIKMGQSPQGETCNETGKGIPLLNGPSEFTEFYPIPKQYTEDPKKICQEKDILFCVRGSTTGRMNWADRSYAIGRGLASISHKAGTEYNHFLKYSIEYNLSSLLNLTSGSTFPNLTNDYLASFKFHVPELSVQKTISKFLSSLDSKIELNNKINAELEAMAKTIYDYWFVQFDFPNAKGKPYKSSGGKMVFNEELKREIPEGWEVKEINYFGNVVTGQTPRSEKPEHWGDELPFITPTDFTEKKKYFTSSFRYISTSGKDAFKQKLLPINSILVTCIGSDMGKVAYNEKECLTNQQINSIIPSNSIYGEYIFQFLESIYEYLVSMAQSGSTVPILNKSTFEKIKVLKPKEDIVESFSKIVEPINEKIKVNLKENQKLAELRDWLLPMLMNGQVKVSEL